MADDNQFARWAAAFLGKFQEAENPTGVASGIDPRAPDADYPGLTRAAGDLLRSVDAGGVPAFVTGNLLRIAADNGVAVAAHWTPNEIVTAIRVKSSRSAPKSGD